MNSNIVVWNIPLLLFTIRHIGKEGGERGFDLTALYESDYKNDCEPLQE
ncbi:MULTISPECIES: hypothetical protein [unclassified Paenibacillus]|nr:MULTISPECIES: hypothetical protein [unclassified Paenibacillus]MBD8837011.1 hypothetical protein [Paenibacillus sp. CFBP 13594]QZN74504.1 hypothetical protein K5K90_24355 [Paenibacillus sp. DR312]